MISLIRASLTVFFLCLFGMVLLTVVQAIKDTKEKRRREKMQHLVLISSLIAGCYSLICFCAGFYLGQKAKWK